MKGWHFFTASVGAVITGIVWHAVFGTDVGIALVMIGIFVLPVFGVGFGVSNLKKKNNTPERRAERQAAQQAAQQAYEAERQKRLLAARIDDVKYLGSLYKDVYRGMYRGYEKVLYERFAVRYGDGRVSFEEVTFGSSRHEALMSHIPWEEIAAGYETEE